MAARFSIAPQAAYRVETHINNTIDGLIALLNIRRAKLLAQVRDAREDKRATEVTRKEMRTQLNTARTHIQTDLKENPLQSIQARITSALGHKLRELRENIPAETKLRLQCDTRDLEARISSLGEILHVPIRLPNYAIFHLPNVATVKQGKAPGELNYPYGVAINEATNQLFVANCTNNRVEIFSETGEYLNQLGDGQLNRPWGITIHENNVYISSYGKHTISKYSIDFSFVKQMGEAGSNNRQFKHPLQITTDPNGHLFVADSGNNRICVLDTDLNHLRNITHQLISYPYDLKVSSNRVYVLCPFKNPCMLVLSLEGHMLHSLINRGHGMDVLEPWFFCLDINNNFVISDRGTHSIRVFSSTGNLLHTIGSVGHQQGLFYQPHGIAITPKGKLVCVSQNDNFGLQIFC